MHTAPPLQLDRKGTCSINVAAKPSPEALFRCDFLGGFVELMTMERPDGGCHVTRTVAKTIHLSAGQKIRRDQSRVAQVA